MFDFHKDKQRYFNIQKQVTEEDIIPFIEQASGPCHSKRVLEIGCAEAGVLKAFIDQDNTGMGIELSIYRYEMAKSFLYEDIQAGRAQIINKNIYDITHPASELGGLFDLIILKDVIEHIPQQEVFIPRLKDFLAPDGSIFFAYPPWWMPFGGHQQICNSKWIRVMPWIHLLPSPIYTLILKAFGESKQTINELLEIKSTGINIEKLYSILAKHHFQREAEIFWFFNPIYQFKFGVNKRKVFSVLTYLPYLRNFYTTAHYVLFKVKKD